MESFGVGNSVKLPGLTVQQPNRYDFDATTYEEIYNDLKQKDESFYTSNGLLDMMQRDMGVKPRPQRWQNRTDKDGLFDVIVTFEKRVMDIVIADLQSKNGVHPCAVINMEVKDSASEAQVAAPHALKLCTTIADVGEDWEEEIDSILSKFSDETKREMSYDICYL